MNRRKLLLGAFAVAALPASAYAQYGERFLIAQTATAPNPEGDVLEVAAATGQFTRFIQAVEAAGYAETLRGEGPFTIFAPTDEAFRRMEPAERTRLLEPRNRDELVALLSYHVVAERVTAETIGPRVSRIESANGYNLTVDARDGLRVNDQLVVMPDVNARNGVIHGINAVLQRPVLVASVD
jgi:uncharacterized surface protein with fasciclin (FAS1) repeats